LPRSDDAKPMAGRRRTMRLMLAAVAAPLSATQALAASEVRVVTTDDTPATRRVVEALKSRFPRLVVGTDPGSLSRRVGPAIYLAVGPAALRAVLASGLQAPVVSLFTSSQAFHQIVDGATPPSHRRTTAIYAEVSPQHQMRLISAIFQRRVSVGVLLTEGTAPLEPLLARAARDADVEIQAHHTRPNANIVRDLNRLAAAQVLLALPDASVFSPDNFRDILESTYRRGQPIVCFSQGMVAAGCLAAAYAAVEDIAAQAAEVVAQLEAGRVPPPHYPAYWRVAINDSVARSLNIVIPDDARALGDRPARSR
jgi:putative ABC transport system substrate-binding protein